MICNYLLTTTTPNKNRTACRRDLARGPQPCPYITRQHACPHHQPAQDYILGDEKGGVWAFAIALAESFHYRPAMPQSDIDAHWLTKFARTTADELRR
jgi:hypothetical protein